MLSFLLYSVFASLFWSQKYKLILLCTKPSLSDTTGKWGSANFGSIHLDFSVGNIIYLAMSQALVNIFNISPSLFAYYCFLHTIPRFNIFLTEIKNLVQKSSSEFITVIVLIDRKRKQQNVWGEWLNKCSTSILRNTTQQ